MIVDARSARIMGFDPPSIPFLRMAHKHGAGVATMRDIELAGDDDSVLNLGFFTRKSLVIWGDLLIRRGALQPLEHLLLHSPLVAWAPFASNVYHNWLWYPTIGRSRLRAFMRTEWSRLFNQY
jgi:hypothetical protein